MSSMALSLPSIIQGGMGIGVSNWMLARAVSLRGQLGVVSGTAIDSLLVRRLQDGDPGGHIRRAMAAFPFPDVSAAALKSWFLPEGRPPGTPYRLLPMWRHAVGAARERIAMLGSFVEVYLAKENHAGVVGMNLLTKVQLPNLATIYGAMLAGVDCIIMGAGIPRDIPAALDAFAEGRAASMKLDVEGESGVARMITFDPRAHFDNDPPALGRPRFLPVVAAHSLATVLARKASGRVDGFVVEGPTAGGHNAPARGPAIVNDRGEPVYGERDIVDLDVMRSLGVPFWLAGGTGSPEALAAARAAGAAGIQVGTLFAYADESGITPELRNQVLDAVRNGTIDVFTDPRASPTGFPFKIVRIAGTNSEEGPYRARERVCDLGYLRVAYRRRDGRIGYRCAAEPVSAYVQKGGNRDDTAGRKCLCNALMANIGHAQARDGSVERPIITSGDDLARMQRFLDGRSSYSAADVIDYLLG